MITTMIDSGLFDGVAPDEFEKLKRTLKLRSRRLNAGEILIDEGERMDAFWLLVSGRLQGARCYQDGGIDLVQFYSAGDTVCLDVVCTRTRKSLLQISCVRPSEVVTVDYELLSSSNVRGAVRDTIAKNIVRLLADESMRKQYKIDVLYKKSMRARIVTFLLHMAEKVDGDSFDIGMDREQLAQYLGVNRSALSHELSLMRSEGLINFSKSRFELTDRFYIASNAPLSH
ncbi:MAG: Crp/Fnr family transcriptional regulator [Clostridiales Family XIII bacterium]|jgi:CRP-like cAMP-binding protein|nr:Crp/Fnr family transcriptional regulator [Clostridiales Family XIII bacterium]